MCKCNSYSAFFNIAILKTTCILWVQGHSYCNGAVSEIISLFMVVFVCFFIGGGGGGIVYSASFNSIDLTTRLISDKGIVNYETKGSVHASICIII